MAVHRHKAIARLGLMHMVAANICVWIATTIRETQQEFVLSSRYSAGKHNSSHATYTGCHESSGETDSHDSHDLISTSASLPHNAHGEIVLLLLLRSSTRKWFKR